MPAPGQITHFQTNCANELLKDGDQTAAYIRAGGKAPSPTQAQKNANQIFRRQCVKDYLVEIRKPVIEAAQLSLAEHLNSLAELRDEARAEKQYGPSVSAEVSRGKASGLYVEKVQHSGDLTIGLADRLVRAKQRINVEGQ